jgi:uncharacterized protein
VRGVALGAAALVAAALAIWWLFFFLTQRSLIFPTSMMRGTATGPPPGVEAVWLPIAGGRVEAWLLRADAPSGHAVPLLLFAHGNAELIDHWASEFETPREWGVSALLVEFPGYGRSAGRPSEASVTEALVAAYDWAVSSAGVDPRRIVGYGRSLGSAAVCALARERELAALVLESTFSSVPRMARGFGIPSFLVRDRFDSLSVLRRFEGPVLVIHGERDTIVPPFHASLLHEAASDAELVLLPCGHNDCPRPWDLLRAFLERHDLLRDPAAG